MEGDHQAGEAASHQLTGKTVDLLVKDGFSSMQAIALLESVDLAQSKIPPGQQKLLLKSVVELRPPVAAGPDRDGETTAIASTATGAHVARRHIGERQPARGDHLGGGGGRRGPGAWGGGSGGKRGGGSGKRDHCSCVSQHPVTDIFAGMAVEHMRSMQATCGARHHATTDTNVTAPPFYAGATGASSLFGGQQQRQPQPPAVGNTTRWQDLRIYLAAAAVGKPHDILDYLSYSTKVYELTQRYENTSVYLYDREYRKLQAYHGFRWGTDIPHLQTIRLIPRVSRSDRRPRPQHSPMTGDGRAICRLYNTQRGCGYTDCKFVHACSYRGYFQVHPATVHLSPQ